MIKQLIEADKEALVYLNGLFRSEWADVFMWWFSQMSTWLPVSVILGIIIIKTKKKEALWILLAIGLTILIADQVSSGFIKPLAARFRPTHEPTLEGMVQTVRGYMGGKYGFVSSHAANSFGIALFTALLFREKLFGTVIITWSIIDCYSRIYLGVHYPGDIIGGIIVGTCAALISYELLIKLRPQCLGINAKASTTEEHHGFAKREIRIIAYSMIASIVILAIIALF